MPQSKNLSFWLSGGMIIALVFIIYSNTLHSPWILDDFHNVKDNPRIQISRLSFQSLKDSFFSKATSKRLYRPLSCATFAINAFFSKDNVLGYHLFNLTLHAINAMMMLWLLIHVFRTPALKEIPDREKHFIIILSTLLWAVNPVQIQAITYIVQRMAALCAFFSLMSLVFFIKARLAESSRQKIIYYISCTLSIVCSFLSKENGIVTIPLILLVEYFLFRKGDYRILTSKEFIAGFLIFIALALCFLFYTTSLTKLQAIYERRPFTLYERLLTQPKILLYYLSLIFYPLPERFSLEHEILISSGLFSPPQTFLYLSIVVLSFASCLFLKQIPLLIRFGIVFFFVAQSIECSILPLEMVFEHRNYLPSAFLFPPIATGLYRLYDHFRSRKRLMMRATIFLFITAMIFLISLATYTRNFDWRSDETIWLDAMKKAPGHARPKQAMGFAIGMKNPEKALNYYSQALTGYMHNPGNQKTDTFSNMGLLYFYQRNYDRAQHFFKLAIETTEEDKLSFYFLMQTYMKEGSWEKTIALINKKMTDEKPLDEGLAGLKAACLLCTGDYQQSLDLFREIYRMNPKNRNVLLNIAESLSMAGYSKRANLFYNFYISKNPKAPDGYLKMAKNAYFNGDTQKASELLSIFFHLTGVKKAGKYFQSMTTDILNPLIEAKAMQPFIESEFEIYKKNIRFLHKPSG